jgi:hypothetical protein
MKFRSDMYKTINFCVIKVGEIGKAKDLSAPLRNKVRIAGYFYKICSLVQLKFDDSNRYWKWEITCVSAHLEHNWLNICWNIKRFWKRVCKENEIFCLQYAFARKSLCIFLCNWGKGMLKVCRLVRAKTCHNCYGIHFLTLFNFLVENAYVRKDMNGSWTERSVEMGLSISNHRYRYEEGLSMESDVYWTWQETTGTELVDSRNGKS